MSTNIDYYSALVQFDTIHRGGFADCFCIIEDESDFFEDWLHDVEEDKITEYSKTIKIFASADGTGARYAFWYKEGNTDPNKAPIIYYGSEGDISIVADDIKDLIKILSFGQECNEGTYYNGWEMEDDDFDSPEELFEDWLKYYPHFLTFRSWMKENLDINPVKNWQTEENKEVDQLVKKANKKHKKAFDKWQFQFYPDPEVEEAEYNKEQQDIFEKEKAALLKKLDKKPTADIYIALANNESVAPDINFKLKREYILKAIEVEPEHINAHLQAIENLHYSHPLLAIKSSLKMIETQDNPQDYYYDLARSYEQSKDDEKALKYYTKYIIAHPNDSHDYSHEHIIDICERLKRNAITVFKDTLLLGENYNTYKAIYKLYFKAEEYALASEFALKYIENSDEQAHNYTTESDRFINKELYTEALPILCATIERETWPDRRMRIYNEIGLCHLRSTPRNMEKALSAFQNAYENDKDEPAIHQNLFICGEYYYKIEEYDTALKVLEHCVEHFDYEKERSLEMIKEMKKGKGFFGRLFGKN